MRRFVVIFTVISSLFYASADLDAFEIGEIIQIFMCDEVEYAVTLLFGRCLRKRETIWGSIS